MCRPHNGREYELKDSARTDHRSDSSSSTSTIMRLPGQVGLLLWKNWLLQKRRLCVTIFEVLLPVAFAVLFLIIRGLVKTSDKPPTYYDPRPVNYTFAFSNGATIGYAPGSNYTQSIMERVKKLIDDDAGKQNFVNIAPFPTEAAALDNFTYTRKTMRQIVLFDDDTGTSTELKVTIRPYTEGNDDWRTDMTYPPFLNGNPAGDNKLLYLNRGVISLQLLLGQAQADYWKAKMGGTADSLGLSVKRFVYPAYHQDNMNDIIQNILPLFLVLSFILSVIITTKNLVYEKERKLKESMKLMGLTPAAHWVSWFITSSVYLVPAMAIYSILFCVPIVPNGAVLLNTDGSLFFVFLLCYALAIITYCFMVSTFVQKANVGAALSGILFFAFFFPYYFIQSNYDGLAKGPKIIGSLLFNCAMGLGANCLSLYEGTGEGAQWNNFHKPATVDDNLSLLECMIMLLADSAIYFLITWYLDNVLPGEFGVPKPFYFCFMKSYWCGGSSSSDDNLNSRPESSKYFEKDPTGKEAGIQICNLKKKYKNKIAVAGTSLNMYQGQITVLLGHNGAGKTTTMSMLTGFTPPTSGTAIVNGYDIKEDIVGVRSSLGLCPQHDILFDTLTVEEHLRFFGKLKGYKGPSLSQEVLSVAREVGLETKFLSPAQSLSGGQKRKLSVGIALIGGSKVVILDEPSSGMDPAARRQIWNVLQRAKVGRTLVLSTHYMDEADVLGDRIAIMAEGVVKCCGTSMFLKKLYGAGYHLVVVKATDCDVNKLTDAIQSMVPTAELETIINSEVSYLLPDNESSKFADLFRDLDKRREQLRIISFGTTATTMEEVFLKVGDSAEMDTAEDTGNGHASNGTNGASYYNQAYDQEKSNLRDPENNGCYGVFGHTNKIYSEKRDPEVSDIMAFNKGFRKNTGNALEMSRIYGLFVKKALHTWRNRTVTFVQLLLPVIFTIVGLAIDEARPQGKPDPLLTFSMSPFGNTRIPYSNATSSPAHLSKEYHDQFDGSPHTLIPYNPSSGLTFDNFTLEYATSAGLTEYNKKYIIGMEEIPATKNKTIEAIAYYSGQPYHAMPISVNYLMNAFLRQTLNSSFSFKSSVFPLPKEDSDAAKANILLALSAGFSIGFFIAFGMSFLTTLFMYFLIKERQVGAKHMQVVSGVGPFMFWLPTFLWDFINYIVPSLLLLVVFAAYSKSAYLDDNRWGDVILLLALYGWAVLPFMYALQFAFKSPPSGVVVVIMLNIISGLITTVAVFVLQIPSLDLVDVAKALDWIFMVIFPNYNMASCFINMYSNYQSLGFCAPLEKMCSLMPGNPCCKDTCTGALCYSFEHDYLSWNKPGIGAYLFFMALQGFVFFVVLMLIEYHIFQRIWYVIRGAPHSIEEQFGFNTNYNQMEDSDVVAERTRINSSPASVLAKSDPLLLVNLYKRYTNFVAVDHICVGVPEQECFGLLGQNGAGKTTTFKMLTGDVMVTGGNAYLKGFDVRNQIKQVQANMGYCPQFDALIDQMTGRETLFMYARLRGIPEQNIPTVVEALLDILMLQPHADKLAGLYSGGNKRKLSTAIALVGDPPFIMLDEPSSGMDPKARRQLWNVLSQVRASGRTMVLTSHSMEECDALCTRIAIMVNGRFMCLGSPQHLKSKFGQGYTLITQLGILPDGNTAPNRPVIDYITSHFPGTMVFDDHQGYVHFQVPDATVKLADVFSIMESAKKQVNVEDYSVHQTTLEQVFLTFTRAQVQPQEETPKGCMQTFPRCC